MSIIIITLRKELEVQVIFLNTHFSRQGYRIRRLYFSRRARAPKRESWIWYWTISSPGMSGECVKHPYFVTLRCTLTRISIFKVPSMEQIDLFYYLLKLKACNFVQEIINLKRIINITKQCFSNIDKGHSISEGICPKEDVIGCLEFKLTYFDVTI